MAWRTCSPRSVTIRAPLLPLALLSLECQFYRTVPVVARRPRSHRRVGDDAPPHALKGRARRACERRLSHEGELIEQVDGLLGPADEVAGGDVGVGEHALERAA